MSLPFTYIKLTGATNSLTIPLALGIVSNPTPHIIMLDSGIDGLLNSGENISDPQQRQYSNGYVLDTNPVYSGKDITFKVALYSNNGNDVKTVFNFIDTFLNTDSVNGKFLLETDFPKTFKVQFQKFVIEEQSWRKGGRMIVSIYFASE